MVKRANKRVLALLFFSLTMLLLNWQTQKADAAFGQNGIPSESIRIRIIANSDTIRDQAIKRVIRDRLETELTGWVTAPSDLNAARTAIRSHLPEIEKLVGSLLATRGFDYGYSVELAKVDFPDKMFGSRLYAAGEYEALRITLGSGKGQNWWCVLFPPLCFADAVAKDEDGAALKQAVLTKKAADDKAAESAAKAEAAGKAGNGKKADAGKVSANGEDGGQAAAGEQEDKAPKAKFFLWEVLKDLFRWIRGLFR